MNASQQLKSDKLKCKKLDPFDYRRYKKVLQKEAEIMWKI